MTMTSPGCSDVNVEMYSIKTGMLKISEAVAVTPGDQNAYLRGHWANILAHPVHQEHTDYTYIA